MARRQSRNSTSTRKRNQKGKSNAKVFIAIGVICIVAIIGLILWAIQPEDKFSRSSLDRYVELSSYENILDDGASVYVDMSDGMISAYSSSQSKADLQAIINKLAANNAIQFYGLASGKISELNLSHTALYNYMLDPKSYSQQQAPIEETLQLIVSKNQPALMMSDFEEYNNGRIQTAAYAKKYFIEWLAKGYNITFYKWDYTEGKKSKRMFFAVFDDNANRLNSLVSNALSTVDPYISIYVLGSREFSYPTSTSYPSLQQGGNYHNAAGKDIVTAVLENGGSEDYICYAKPYASANGMPGQFAPLDQLLGSYSEYYPIGVSWQDAIKNSKMMQETGVSPENQFTHLFSNLFIDFGAQDGYTIDGIEVRVFDVQDLVTFVGQNDSVDRNIKTPELNEIFIAGKESTTELPDGWAHIFVDFDDKFNGTFPNNTPSTDLLKANIVISKASPNIREANEFFEWPGNPSLSNSIIETLTAASSNPAGRILFTYYIKTLSE